MKRRSGMDATDHGGTVIGGTIGATSVLADVRAFEACDPPPTTGRSWPCSCDEPGSVRKTCRRALRLFRPRLPDGFPFLNADSSGARVGW
jgi:hypothetical protein